MWTGSSREARLAPAVSARVLEGAFHHLILPDLVQEVSSEQVSQRKPGCGLRTAPGERDAR